MKGDKKKSTVKKNTSSSKNTTSKKVVPKNQTPKMPNRNVKNDPPKVKKINLDEINKDFEDVNNEDKRLSVFIAIAILVIVGTVIGLLVGCEKKEQDDPVKPDKPTDVVVPDKGDKKDEDDEDDGVKTREIVRKVRAVYKSKKTTEDDEETKKEEEEEVTYNVTFYLGEKAKLESVQSGKKSMGYVPAGYSSCTYYKDSDLTEEYDITSKVTENVNVYMSCDLIDYTINYVSDSETTNQTTYNVEEGEVVLEDPEPVFELLFKGWFTESEYTNQVTALNENLLEYADDKNNITLYANLVKSNLVVFNFDESEYQFKVETGKSSDMFVPDGYSSCEYYADEKLTEEYDITAPVTEDKSVYMTCELIKYTINYGEDVITDNPSSYTVKDEATKLADPNTELEFVGWFVDSEFNNQVTMLNESIIEYANDENVINLYAKFNDDEEGNTDEIIGDDLTGGNLLSASNSNEQTLTKNTTGDDDLINPSDDEELNQETNNEEETTQVETSGDEGITQGDESSNETDDSELKQNDDNQVEVQNGTGEEELTQGDETGEVTSNETGDDSELNQNDDNQGEVQNGTGEEELTQGDETGEVTSNETGDDNELNQNDDNQGEVQNETGDDSELNQNDDNSNNGESNQNINNEETVQSESNQNVDSTVQQQSSNDSTSNEDVNDSLEETQNLTE